MRGGNVDTQKHLRNKQLKKQQTATAQLTTIYAEAAEKISAGLDARPPAYAPRGVSTVRATA